MNVIVYGWAVVDKIRGEHGTNMGEARLGKARFLGDILQSSSMQQEGGDCRCQVSKKLYLQEHIFSFCRHFQQQLKITIFGDKLKVIQVIHLTHLTYQASCQLDINTKCSRITFISLFNVQVLNINLHSHCVGK